MGLTGFSSHSRRGRALESLIEIHQAGIVCLTKLNADAKHIGEGRMVAAKGPVDYVGEVCASGRSICFDAKECSKAKGFSVRDYVKPHQVEYLERHGRAGAVAGLLVGATHAEVNLYLWLPWDAMRADLVRWESDEWVECGTFGGAVKWGKVPGVVEEMK